MSDGPSFLTTPPSIAPESNEGRGVVVTAPVSTPFRQPGVIATPKSTPASTPRRTPVDKIVERQVESKQMEQIGDSAGEHLWIEHGKYSAWTHVVIAFILEVIALGAAPAFALGHMLRLGDIGIGIGGAVGLAGAIWVFNNRWRCIEAFSSKFCSGVMNLSLLYVPAVAFIYANARGLGKLRRR